MHFIKQLYNIHALFKRVANACFFLEYISMGMCLKLNLQKIGTLFTFEKENMRYELKSIVL